MTKKIDQILKLLIGKKLRAKHIAKELGVDTHLVYCHLNTLLKQGKIRRTNDESPYIYTADNIPEVFLLRLWNLCERYYEIKAKRNSYGNYIKIEIPPEDLKMIKIIENYLENKFGKNE